MVLMAVLSIYPILMCLIFQIPKQHVLQAVPEQQDERQALAGLVGSSGGLGGLQ